MTLADAAFPAKAKDASTALEERSLRKRGKTKMETAELEWGKILAHFLDGKSFKFMKKAKAEGIVDLRDKLEAVWWELIGLALQCNNHGALWNESVSCGHINEIAVLTDRTETEVKVCVDWYCSQGMAEMTKNGLIILNFDKYQFIDKIEEIKEKNRLRQQKFRDSRKLIEPPSRDHNVTVTSPSRNPSQETLEVDGEPNSKEEQELVPSTPKVVEDDRGDKYDKPTPSWAKDLCPLTQELIKRKFLTYTDLELFTVDSYLQDRLEERKDNLPLLYAVIHYVVARYNENEVERKGSWFMSGVTHNLACFDYREKTGWDEAIKKYDPKTPEEWEKVLDDTMPKMIEAYDNEHKQ